MLCNNQGILTKNRVKTGDGRIHPRVIDVSPRYSSVDLRLWGLQKPLYHNARSRTTRAQRGHNLRRHQGCVCKPTRRFGKHLVFRGAIKT